MRTFSNRRIVSFVLLGLLLIGTGMVTGCGAKPQEPKDGQGQGLTGTLTTAGSTSVQPFSEVLAEKFMEKNPNVKVNVQGGGSSQGIEAALSGVAEIGAISRDLKDEEKAKGLTAIPIAIDGVAVVVNPLNKVADLTAEDVKNIYLGNIKNWKEVGGDNAPITVVSREEGSGTRDAFSDKIMNKEDIVNSAVIQNSTGAVRTAVAGDKNAIGYISIPKVNNEVKAVSLNGVEPTEVNVKNGSYPLSRTFNYVVKGQPGELAKAFIDFVLSEEGQSIIAEEGAFKLK